MPQVQSCVTALLQLRNIIPMHIAVLIQGAAGIYRCEAGRRTDVVVRIRDMS